MIRIYSGTAPPAPGAAALDVAPWRLAAATALRSTSTWLEHTAHALLAAPARRATAADTADATVEFAKLDNGDGALYIDGVLIAQLPGVGRL